MRDDHLICVQCKNEKWGQDVCPVCGLGEKDALLLKAETCKTNCNYPRAVEYYEKCLSLEMENIDALMGKANCLYFEAKLKHEMENFKKAEDSLRAVLDRNWNWKKGHQLRIDLFLSYEKLDQLLEDYEKVIKTERPSNQIAMEMVNIIQLTIRFKENPPKVLTEVSSKAEWGVLLKSFWPLLLGLPFLLWLLFKITSAPHAREYSNVPALFFILIILVTAIVLIIYICMRMYKNNRKKANEGNLIVKAD